MGTTSTRTLLKQLPEPPFSVTRTSRIRSLVSLLSTSVLGSLLLQSGAVHGQRAAADDDPANLRCERVRPMDAEPLAVDRGAPGLAGLLRKLGTRASLLMIVAHPDDEDGGMLTYVSRGLGARVGMLTLTRGEGGQNVMSGDFNDALGLVRTRELLAADRYLAVDQMFGTEVDFGFSKTKEEAFSQWTHQRVLYDAVRAVRLYRPLVLTSVFVGGPTDGHGQHQVSGEMAQEVFTAAADPKVFPEMNLPVWAPLKVYARVPFAPIDARGMYDYATGKYIPARFYNYVTQKWSTEAPEATVTVPEGEMSPLLGMSYVQFARQGLALQKSQIGTGVRVPPAGKFDVGYTRYGTRTGVKSKEASFFDGVDITLPGIVTLAPSLGPVDRTKLQEDLGTVQRQVAALETEASSGRPASAAAPALRDVLQELDGLITRVTAITRLPERERSDLLHELRVKRVQANDALVMSLGLQVRAQVVGQSGGPMGDRAREGGDPLQPVAIPGDHLAVEVSLVNGGSEPLQAHDETPTETRGVIIRNRTTSPAANAKVLPGSTYKERIEADIRADAPFSRPYFTRTGLEQPFYDVREPALRNAPISPAALTVSQRIDWRGVSLHLEAIVTIEAAASTKDEAVAQPLQIVPPFSLALVPAVAILPESRKDLILDLKTSSAPADSVRSSLRLDLPKGWTASPFPATFEGAKGGDGSKLPITITPVGLGTKELSVSAVAEHGGKQYREGYQAVGYPGIVHDNSYRPATTRVRGIDIKVPPNLKIAYLPGTGDAVEETFAQMGVAASTVSVADIAAGRLAGYDALVMGVRAYAAHKDLPEVTAKVLAFARAGGSVVVQYNTAEYGGNNAPFSLSLGSAEKVVEETAAVRLLQPKSQVLSWPNHITEHDFDGWIEERGHGFMSEWDVSYAAVTEVHDAGQDPQRGGLLVAPVGKGAYVYCAYALYRQLPEGVPGAYRLLANMVSLGRKQ